MDEGTELSYSRREVRRYLPLGWSLTDDPEAGRGGERGARQTWVTTVRDGSGLDWQVRVKPEQAKSLGRFEALRQAMAATTLHL